MAKSKSSNQLPSNYIQLKGSERRPSPSATLIGATDKNEAFKVTIVLRRRPDGPPLPDHQHFLKHPAERKPLSQDEFASKYGASDEDIQRVADFAVAHKLKVIETHAAKRTVVVSGTVAQMEKAFAVSLNQYQHEIIHGKKPHQAHTEVYRGRDGFIHVPKELADIITGVFGLDNRNITKRNSADPPNTVPLSISQITNLYNFPTNSASGQTIGIASPSGGFGGFFQSDLQSFFGAALPTITPVPIDSTNNGSIEIATTASASAGQTKLTFASTAGVLAGSSVNSTTGISFNTFVGSVTSTTVSLVDQNNNPRALTATVPSGKHIFFNPDGETTQDVCIAASAAPGANIAVYFSPGGQSGWVDMFKEIGFPTGSNPHCSVVSSSFYICDGDDSGTLGNEGVSSGFLNAVSDAFHDATMQGVTICIASGDTGSSSKVGGNPSAWGYSFSADNKAHVQFPGSSPWVLAVGGTTIGNVNGSSFDEYVWNDPASGDPSNWGTTGGGISDFFDLPSYQDNASVPKSVNDNTHVGRGVPDVAGDASINSGYANIVLAGGTFTGNGTSGSSPLWAGFIAVINAAFGENLGFVNPILYTVGTGMCTDIVPGAGPTDNSNSGITGYPAGTGWDACTGWGSPNGTSFLNGLKSYYHQSLYFIVDKSTYGTDEVSDTISTAGGTFPEAFWLALEGFTIHQVNGALPSLLGPFSTAAGIQINADSVVYELPGQLHTPQRILFPFDIKFTSTASFPATGSAPIIDLLGASITVNGSQYSAETAFELVAGADPYFTNINPNDNNVFYLSQDLRVFSVAAGDTAVPGSTAFTSDPYASIQSLLSFMNSSNTFTVPGTTDPLNTLPGQSGYETGDSSVTPLNPSNHQNYNFAIARVRLQDTPLSSANNVRVFFRLFVAQSCDTDFQPATTYKSTLGTSGADTGNPVFPLPSGTGLMDPSGQSTQTIPFFSTDANGTHDYDSTVANGNIRTILLPSGQDKIWAYYGCFLDVYDGSNQSKFPGTHHCIVAEIACDNSPIINPSGVTMSPENSDKLAQRNLQITSSGNPSFPATHRIPQAFDMRPSLPVSSQAGLLLDYPDELMIDWGNTPIGSIANLYWPQINAADVLELASKLYTTQTLSASDANTIQCQVTDGLTYIPIPSATGKNFAGLFTLDLPNTISINQEFNVKVRRISSRQPAQQQPPPVIKTGPSSESVSVSGKRNFMRNWRYITGTFQVKIPVAADNVLLHPEENTLAILKWRLENMPPAYRWYPVLQRYISYISTRVDGFGGNASEIGPSLTGVPVQGREKCKSVHYKGKVCEVAFDCFGEFEGFVLDICCAEPRAFKCREKNIGELVLRACSDRWLISVGADSKTHKIHEISVLC